MGPELVVSVKFTLPTYELGRSLWAVSELIVKVMVVGDVVAVPDFREAVRHVGVVIEYATFPLVALSS